MTCAIQVNRLDGEKFLFDDIHLPTATIQDVFDRVATVEPDTTRWNLMAVIRNRLVPMRRTQKERKLVDLGMEENQQYRIEVCLAWSELKKCLT